MKKQLRRYSGFGVKEAAMQIGISRGRLYRLERRGLSQPLRNYLNWRFYTPRMIKKLRNLVMPK